MIEKFFIAWCLVAATVLMHASGLALILGPALRTSSSIQPRFWPVMWLLIRVAWWFILIHLAEIFVWALFYWWKDCLPDAESSFYFSGVTYSTIGYGDLVLMKEWRFLGPVQGLTGILMCGLSTGFFFALVSKLYLARHKKD